MLFIEILVYFNEGEISVHNVVYKILKKKIVN